MLKALAALPRDSDVTLSTNMAAQNHFITPVTEDSTPSRTSVGIRHTYIHKDKTPTHINKNFNEKRSICRFQVFIVSDALFLPEGLSVHRASIIFTMSNLAVTFLL